MGQVFGAEDVVVELPPQPGMHAVLVHSSGAGAVDIKAEPGGSLASGATSGAPFVLEWSTVLTTEYIRVVLPTGGFYYVFPYAPTTPNDTILEETSGYLRGERGTVGRGLSNGLMGALSTGIANVAARRQILATLIFDGYGPKAGVSPLASNAPFLSRGRPLQMSAHVRGDSGATITLRCNDGTSLVLDCETGLTAGMVRSAESADIGSGPRMWSLEADASTGLEIYSISIYEGAA
jgi:hypothetical protein